VHENGNSDSRGIPITDNKRRIIKCTQTYTHTNTVKKPTAKLTGGKKRPAPYDGVGKGTP